MTIKNNQSSAVAPVTILKSPSPKALRILGTKVKATMSAATTNNAARVITAEIARASKVRSVLTAP